MSRADDAAPSEVLHVITSTRRRGAEVFAVELAAALAERGFPGRVLALTGGGSLEVDGVGRGRFDPRTLTDLRRSARNASLVVAHGSSTLLAAAIATVGTSTPFIYRNIGDPHRWVATRSRRMRVGFLLRRAARVVALWPGAGDRLADIHRLDRSRVDVAANGVDGTAYRMVTAGERCAARARLGVPLDAPSLCFVGSLTDEKDPATALRAVGEIAGAHLLVAGDGRLRNSLERAADDAMPGRVTFLGYVDDVRPVLAASDVLVLTSRTEGLPAVLIEAGLSGIPVVASAVGGVPEIVQDGVTGFLVAPGDTSGFAAAISRALRSGSPMGAAARARCLERFSMGAVADRWVSVLQTVRHERVSR